MLSLETVAVLGALLGLLVHGMVRAQMAKARGAQVKREVEEGATGAGKDAL
jgi:hypothetical protein